MLQTFDDIFLCVVVAVTLEVEGDLCAPLYALCLRDVVCPQPVKQRVLVVDSVHHVSVQQWLIVTIVNQM